MHLKNTWFTVLVAFCYLLGLFMAVFLGVVTSIAPESQSWIGVIPPRVVVIHIQLAGIGLLLAGILLCLFEAYKANPKNWGFSERDLKLMEELRKATEDYDQRFRL